MNNARLNLLQLEQDLAAARNTDAIADKRRELARDQTFLLYTVAGPINRHPYFCDFRKNVC